MGKRYRLKGKPKAWVERDRKGRFKKWTKRRKSAKPDRRRVTRRKVKPGYGHRGDQRRRR